MQRPVSMSLINSKRAPKTNTEPPQMVVMDPANAGRLTEYIISPNWAGGSAKRG